VIRLEDGKVVADEERGYYTHPGLREALAAPSA